ncbi:MAG: hypothetical protein AAFN74_20835 [Myxococcota bacterium]
MSRLSFLPGLTAALLLSVPFSALADDDEADAGWIPARYSSRPLTLVDGLFRLDFSAGGGTIDRRDVAVELLAGAGYGVSDDFEIGLTIVNVVVSPSEESGLDTPFGYLRYRWANLGVLQSAVEAGGDIPVGGEFGFFGALPTLVAVAGFRLDLRPEIFAMQDPDWQTGWRTDGRLSVQIVDAFRLFAGTRISEDFSGAFEPLAQPLGGAVITLGNRRQPMGDLEIEVRGPAFRLTGDSPIARTIETDWFVFAAYRPFIRPPASGRTDPFEDPEGW